MVGCGALALLTHVLVKVGARLTEQLPIGLEHVQVGGFRSRGLSGEYLRHQALVRRVVEPTSGRSYGTHRFHWLGVAGRVGRVGTTFDGDPIFCDALGFESFGSRSGRICRRGTARKSSDFDSTQSETHSHQDGSTFDVSRFHFRTFIRADSDLSTKPALRSVTIRTYRRKNWSCT